jgi:exosortase/archaeosortase family protein
MRLFDIPVLRQGNVIELLPLGSSTTKKLEVVEACSGIRSLMTLVTLAVVFAYFTHPKSDDDDKGGRFGFLRSYATWRSLILVASAVPIAIITNAARVSGTGILSRYYGTKVADGFFHDFSGWVIYIIAFLMLFALGWVLDRFGRLGKRESVAAREAEAVVVKTEAANDAGAVAAGNGAAAAASVAHGNGASAERPQRPADAAGERVLSS